MEFPIRFGTAVHKKGSRFWMHLPATMADALREEGIAMYQQQEGLLVGYSEELYKILGQQLMDFSDRWGCLWPEKLLERNDAYPLMKNNETEHVPIEGRQKIWLPRKFAPKKQCAAVVSIVNSQRFSIEYLLTGRQS